MQTYSRSSSLRLNWQWKIRFSYILKIKYYLIRTKVSQTPKTHFPLLVHWYQDVKFRKLQNTVLAVKGSFWQEKLIEWVFYHFLEVNFMIWFFIQEGAQALLSAALAGSKLPNIINKANEYILRAEELKKASKWKYNMVWLVHVINLPLWDVFTSATPPYNFLIFGKY